MTYFTIHLKEGGSEAQIHMGALAETYNGTLTGFYSGNDVVVAHIRVNDDDADRVADELEGDEAVESYTHSQMDVKIP